MLNVAAPHARIATVAATGERGRWRVDSRGALEGQTSLAADISVVLARASLAESSLSGRVRAQSAHLEDALRDLRRNGFLSADLETVLHGGRATAAATITGTLASPRLEARLAADSLALGRVEQVRAEAEVRLAGRAVEITRMTADAPGNHLELRGTATAGNGPIHLAVNARLDRPELLAAALPAEWRPSGSLVLSGTLDGSPANPRLAARISGSGLEANGIAADLLQGDVTVAQGVLDVTGLRLSHGDGWLRLDANIESNPGAPADHRTWGEACGVGANSERHQFSPLSGGARRRRGTPSMTPRSNSISPARRDNRRGRSRWLPALRLSTVARSGAPS